MCGACEWQSELTEIDARLVQSSYVHHAAELITLAQGIKERQHVGDAIAYRLVDLDAAVKRMVKLP